MENKILIQILISIFSLVFIILHMIWPNLKIDTITLGLVIVVIIPWLAPLFKSLKLPGGIELEYQDLKRAENKIRQSGLLKIDRSKRVKENNDIYIQPTDDDPTLILAWLRIEIEKQIKRITRENNLPENNSLRQSFLKLEKKNIITREETAALSDMVGVLNQAIHGEPIKDIAADWALKFGPVLLKSLGSK